MILNCNISDHWLKRGFTGHEHLDNFALINMNGRLYDPMLGRMLSPDNYVQLASYTQSFNRYSYCLNNPLKYTDPSGEFYVIDSWIRGYVRGFLSTDPSVTPWNEVNRMANNDLRIWGGLFVSDPNKTTGGRAWEVASRITWQLPQTALGWTNAQWVNSRGAVHSVKYKYGATVVNADVQYPAVTHGNYIIGFEGLIADENNSLFQHEYGHYIQSQKMGWAYYPRIGIPSARSERGNYLDNYSSHDFHPVEQDANRRAFLYFNEHIEGFTETEIGDDNGWNWARNPLDPNNTGIGQTWDYNNSTDLQSIDRLTVNARWYDHFSLLGFPLAPVIGGLINAGSYNN
jgi:RHS repeat-associated protein